MQTQSIQNQQPNKPQPAKSAPLPNNDFKQALTLEIERAPVRAAPEQPAPAPQTKAPAKNAQPAKPAQAQNANNASQADDAQAPASTDAAAKPATTESTPAEETAESAEDTASVADPAAGMLAMLAAYGQLTGKTEVKPDTAAATGTDAAALAAMQADAAGRATLANLAADARAGKAGAEGTTALQDALADQAGANRLLKAGTDAALVADQQAESFAARLAEAAPAPQPVAQPVAQAMAGAMQAANAVAANQLQARVGTNAWEQQLGQKVVWMVAGGDQSASLTLNPPDLGPLQVVLNVSNDSATATFTAHQPETRQAIENALPKLREMMSEAGIALGNATVSAGSQEQQQAFAEQARGGSGGRNGNAGNGGDSGQQEEAQPVIRRAVLGAVDTFA
ncbi:flagellar hook-length control protein FliK [Massilia sp. METH4]|uniref:flagellar hook-length control protein FliK n=1 Tax=Massilia sp. METH4 TaxID=3123041 RepID=UPI0030D18056